MNEAELRATLARIDDLRARAKQCEGMHTRFFGALDEISVAPKRGRVRRLYRRWLGDERAVMREIVLTRAERDHLRDWLQNRAGHYTAEADRLAAELERKP